MEASPRGIAEPMNDFQTVYPGVPVTLAEANFPNQNRISQEQMVDNGNWFGSYEPGIGVNQDFLEANAGMGYHLQADALQNSTFQDLLELVSAGSNCCNGRASSLNANVDYQNGVSQEQMVDDGNRFGSNEPGIGVNQDFLGANAGMGYHFQADALQNSGFQDQLKSTSAGSNCYNGRASSSNANVDYQSGVSHFPSSYLCNNGNSSPYGLSFDFDLVNGAIPNVASSGSISTLFAPINPDVATRAYKEQAFNLVPGAIANVASRGSILTPFAPITPDEATRAYKEQVFNAPNLSVPETTALKENGNCAADIELNVQLPKNDGNVDLNVILQRNADSQFSVDQSPARLTVDLNENHAPDKGSDQGSELINTPQQKPKKKKHRPKVVKEGQPKRTPKPKTPKVVKEGQPKRTPNPKTPKPAGEGSTPKRKYVRRGSNSTSTPSENKIDNADPLQTPPGLMENSFCKRKYVRRKLNDPESAPLDDKMNIDDGKISRHTGYSCKKSLNFESENLQIDESIGISLDVVSEMPAKDQLNLNEELQLPVDLSLSQEKATVPSPSSKIQPSHMSTIGHQTECSKGKRQIGLSDAIHGKEANIAQLTMGTDTQYVRKSPDRSNWSNNTCLIQEPSAEFFSPNTSGVTYNSLSSYASVLSPNGMNINEALSMLFPVINKKKRTMKWNMAEATKVSSMSAVTEICSTKWNMAEASKVNSTKWTTTESQENRLTPASITWVPPTQRDTSWNPRYSVANYATMNENLIPNSNLRLAENPGAKTKRSRGPTQRCSLQLGICEQLLNYRRESNIHQEVVSQPNRYRGDIVSEFPSTKKTKKRSKRDSTASSSLPYMHSQPDSLKGPPLAITWKPVSLIDEIIERFSLLSINAEGTRFMFQNQYDPLQMSNPEQNALVPYQRDGTIAPFSNSIVPVRKRKPRAKVDLDPETARVWTLLLENIRSEGIDGTDEEKTKWWKEERSVFCGRAESFIARMHLIQGDRRFTPWKGSVVDSVVGVFLTQNVSDHLSSSAYMSLAARYPPKSSIIPGESVGEETSIITRELEVHILEPDDMDDTCHEQSEVDGSAVEVDDIVSSQNSVNYSIDQSGKCVLNSPCTSEEDSTKSGQNLFPSPSFLELLHTVEGNTELQEVFHSNCEADLSEKRDGSISSQNSFDISPENSGLSAGSTTVERTRRAQFEELPKFSSEDENSCYGIGVSPGAVEDPGLVAESQIQHQAPTSHNLYARTAEVTERNLVAENLPDLNQKPSHSSINAYCEQLDNIVDGGNGSTPKEKGKELGKQNQDVDWDTLRRDVQKDSVKSERRADRMDSVDWERIRSADVAEIADTIRARGMNNRLAQRIKDFLDRIVQDHGSIDLEWLRDVLPDKAKEYLLSIKGLGLKSVECVRLLTLHHLAFPVDVNVGRIAVRLGWVPLQPLPESLQLHLLEMYPILESIQQYLWPRLCKLDQRTLYELHYQMITFGKVFCTKSRPNCNACPMRGECRHFASAFASARLALPAPEAKGIVATVAEHVVDQHSAGVRSLEKLCLPGTNRQLGDEVQSSVGSGSCSSTDLCLSQCNKQFGENSESSSSNPIVHVPATPEPNVEEPPSPEPEHDQYVEPDMEDFEDPDEIPTIRLNMEQFAQNLKNLVSGGMELQEHEMSKALVAITAEAASLPTPKLKNINMLRTEHRVYELPDSHPLLEGFERRERDDPSPYLLAIWTPGETADSVEPPEKSCKSREAGVLCDVKTCFSCNSVREESSKIVRGTILIPCRTAMRGSFPLNGTYFQVNEMLADHASSLEPISVPRGWIWNLPRRTVYFGTSVTSIFKGLNTDEIQFCFWRGFVCVRGFEQSSRAPKPLIARLHFPASKRKQATT